MSDPVRLGRLSFAVEGGRGISRLLLEDLESGLKKLKMDLDSVTRRSIDSKVQLVVNSTAGFLASPFDGGKRILPLRWDPPVVQIGPVLGDDRVCPECFRGRIMQHSKKPEMYEFMVQAYGPEGIVQVSSRITTGQRAAITSLLLEYLGDQDSELEDVVTLDIETLILRRDRVVPFSACIQCTGSAV